MKICVIGQGYIGLPTAALFAKKGCEVLGVDINQEIVSNLNKGEIHIEEDGIKNLIENSIENNSYKASTSPQKADVFIITVPTPFKEDLTCDLSYVIQACQSILPYIQKNNIIIIESTIAPMSTDNEISSIFKDYEIGKDLYIAHCPERVIPGNIVNELINNSRIVGGITEECSNQAEKVYKTFVKGEIIKTEAKTAELSKCMENTFRDVNIALANELTKICANLNINALDVIEMSNKHPRVNIHSPGPGVGGHCLAIDPYFIYSKDPENSKMIKLARDINNSMPDFVVENVKKIVKSNTKIAILGLAYKGNTEDMRESPAIEIMNKLESEGYNLKVYDPHVDYKDNLSFKEAIKDTSLCLVLTDHSEFKNINYEVLKSNMQNPIIFDTKNIIKHHKNIVLYNYNNLSKI